MGFFNRSPSKNNTAETPKIDTELKKESVPLRKIDEEFSKALLESFGLEYYFHFTRPLLSREEYDSIEFSITFRKTFYLYESYEKQWNNVYPYYTFECKIHELLVKLLSEEFIDIDPFDNKLRADFHIMFQKRLLPIVNTSEMDRYISFQKNGGYMRTLLYERYRELWMTNKYEPHLIEQKLEEDLLKVQKNCMWDPKRSWSSAFPRMVAEFNERNR